MGKGMSWGEWELGVKVGMGRGSNVRVGQRDRGVLGGEYGSADAVRPNVQLLAKNRLGRRTRRGSQLSWE
eukprot:353932-Chlamydomonas_euryale.AAC.7